MREGQGRPPAQTEREWWSMLKSDDTTFIRSIDDWKAALADRHANPLDGCEDETVRKFTESLVFNNGGLSHANYEPLEKKLTYFQFRSLWARFGLGMGLFADYENKECKSRGTCSPSFGDICTSNC